jgi:hypothetical protein
MSAFAAGAASAILRFDLHTNRLFGRANGSPKMWEASPTGCGQNKKVAGEQ